MTGYRERAKQRKSKNFPNKSKKKRESKGETGRIRTGAGTEKSGESRKTKRRNI